MPVDAAALQAAAANGKAGLAEYRAQQDALQQAKAAAVERLINESRARLGGGISPAAGGSDYIASTLGGTADRQSGYLGAAQNVAGMRQDALGGVPAYLQQHDALVQAEAPWKAAQYTDDQNRNLGYQESQSNLARDFKKRMFTEDMDWQRRKYEAQRNKTPI